MNIGLPNQITLARLVLALVFFGLLMQLDAAHLAQQRNMIAACFWLFLIGALSDVLDGWLARAWGQVTTFGRIVDPVVDKVLVCGAFIFFCSRHFALNGQSSLTGVEPWMVIVILLRELLVSAVRSAAEAGGTKFGALWPGKLKMFLQCTTVCFILGELAWFPGLATTRIALVWATLAVTVMSGWPYLVAAQQALARSHIERTQRETTTTPRETHAKAHSSAGAAS